MKITRSKRTGAFCNTWTEGNTVYTQDLKTGYRSKMTRKQARSVLRDTKNMKAAREYANGEKGK